MKSKNIIILTALLGLMTLAHASEAQSSDTIIQLKDALSKAQTLAKEKIQEWKNFFESEYAKWVGGDSSQDQSLAQDQSSTQLPAQSLAQTQSAQPLASPPAAVVSTGPVVAAPAPTTIPTATVAAPAAPSASKITNEQLQFTQAVHHARQQISEKEALQVLKEGRVGTSVLPKLKSGVPVFALTKEKNKKDKSGKKKTVNVAVSNIPRLDIGFEKSIQKADFLPPKETVDLKRHAKLKELSTPAVFSQKEISYWKNKKLPFIEKAKHPQKGDFQLGQIVTQKKIDGVSIDMEQTRPLENLKPVVEISRDDLNMMVALIIYEKGEKCHLASGLFTELADKRQYAEEANFYLGICSHQMGFHSEAVSRLLKVIESENPDFLKMAITNIVEDLPREHDQKVVSVLKSLKNTSAIEDKAKDNVHYIFARAAHESGNYKEALVSSEKVSELSSHYMAARYLYGVALYGMKKMKEAEESLLNLRSWMVKKNKSDKNIEALIAVNLARIRFMLGRYHSALEEYARIPKDHPLWVQGLIEQGWAQLNTDDPEGAVGNMYSLHSPYFKSVFMPESWVVRTIGYINICQYGDAYKTLSRLEQIHGDWLNSLRQYLSSHKDSSFFYNTVKTYIKGRSDQNVDGLPHQVIREVARQRGFLNAQGALNTKEDEVAQYNFIYDLIKKDQSDLSVKLKRTRARLAKIKNDLLKVKTNPELIKNLNEWNANRRNDEQLVLSYEFQTELFENARKGYLKLKALALGRIDKEKNGLRLLAGKELISHLKDIQARITQIFEGNEFLRYEIFSGSGENIRFQVSGGVVDDVKRIPANVKPQKMLNWEFDGEYWEDEIGSYRSSLKNNCPKNSRTSQAMTEINKDKAKN